ncbi:hypothetical protein cyc_03368 [Cyclospora cayetanensis]|uniref:Uncharacterized protein n=1 Tax=Cyclospora cayetanensis TaxID=88456 RepID=A0A1D3CU25_9EIME|nr:hypothetical protein cyc_03368 [Cyclospora cayetanensis]
MEIYIPPSRAFKASSISLGLTPELPDDLGILEDAAKEIENAISHLKRSNREIQEFDPNGEDPDLVDAIAGNVVALEKKEERLKHIRDRMVALSATRTEACVHSELPSKERIEAPAVSTMNSSEGAARADAPERADAHPPSKTVQTAESGSSTCDGPSAVTGLSQGMRALDIQSTSSDTFEAGIDL